MTVARRASKSFLLRDSCHPSTRATLLPGKFGIRRNKTRSYPPLIGRRRVISNPRPPITGRKRRRRSSLVGGLVEGSRILLKGIKIGYLEGQTLPVTRARQRVIPQSWPSFSRSFEIHDRAGSINRWDRGRMLALPLFGGISAGLRGFVVSIGRRKLSTD